MVASSYSLKSSANKNLIGAHGAARRTVYLEIARAKLRVLRVSAALAKQQLVESKVPRRMLKLLINSP